MANYLAAEGMASSPSSVVALDLSGHGGVRKEIEAPPPAPAPDPEVLAAYTKRWDAPPAPSPVLGSSQAVAGKGPPFRREGQLVADTTVASREPSA